MAVLVIAALTACLVAVSAGPVSQSEPMTFIKLGSSKLTRDNSQTVFHLSAEKATWENAFQICKDELDGKLLALETITKENQIKTFLSGYTLDYIWTSLFHDEGSNEWFWLLNNGDGVEVTYTNWKTGVTPQTGNGYRAAFYKALRPNWQTLPKSNLNRFICEVTQQ